MLLTKTTTGNRSTTPRNVAEYKTAWLSVTIVRESRPVLCPLAETHAGQKLKKRLQEADSLVPAKSHSKKDSRPAKPRARPDAPFPKGCVKTDATDLHRDQGSRPQDSRIVSVQQQCKDEPLDALLPGVDSLLPTSDGTAEGTSQNTDLSLPRFYPSTAVEVGLATPLAIDYLPSTMYYIHDGGSPFDEGYLAMNGPWVANQHRYL